jgi:hypothetical protein
MRRVDGGGGGDVQLWIAIGSGHDGRRPTDIIDMSGWRWRWIGGARWGWSGQLEFLTCVSRRAVHSIIVRI